MRRVCIEIDQLEDQNRGFRDGKLFRLLRLELEYVIRDIGGPRCRWSVERSKHDRRGKSRRRRMIHVDHEVQQALRDRLSPFDPEGPWTTAPPRQVT